MPHVDIVTSVKSIRNSFCTSPFTSSEVNVEQTVMVTILIDVGLRKQQNVEVTEYGRNHIS